jgi:hypothetical protein
MQLKILLSKILNLDNGHVSEAYKSISLTSHLHITVSVFQVLSVAMETSVCGERKLSYFIPALIFTANLSSKLGET